MLFKIICVRPNEPFVLVLSVIGSSLCFVFSPIKKGSHDCELSWSRVTSFAVRATLSFPTFFVCESHKIYCIDCDSTCISWLFLYCPFEPFSACCFFSVCAGQASVSHVYVTYKQCVEGHYSLSTTTECFSCQVGKYANVKALSSCLDCGVGTRFLLWFYCWHCPIKEWKRCLCLIKPYNGIACVRRGRFQIFCCVCLRIDFISYHPVCFCSDE